MITINNIDSERFSLNGIEYYKNFMSFPKGNSIRIVNAYDSTCSLLDYTSFSEINLDGVIHPNIAALQSAILPVIYTRQSLGGGGGGSSLKNLSFACSDETSDLEIGTVFIMYCLFPLTNLEGIDFGVSSFPSGSKIQVDVKKNGSSIYTTKPTIDISELTTLTASVPQVLNGAVSFAAGDKLEVFIDQIGSTIAGFGLKANIKHY